MKDVKKSDRVCVNCRRFMQYYKKGLHNFYPSGYGVCGIKNQSVMETETCESFLRRKNERISVEEVAAAINGVENIEKLLK